jgi:hypothetical protein
MAGVNCTNALALLSISITTKRTIPAGSVHAERPSQLPFFATKKPLACPVHDGTAPVGMAPAHRSPEWDPDPLTSR